jgi:hypothetical protein
MAPPWTDVEQALFREFLPLVEGPPYGNWVQMVKHMSNAIQSRQLACREFNPHILQFYYQRVFKKHLPVQEKQNFEEGMIREALSNLNENWKYADLVKIINHKIVAQGLGEAEYYGQRSIIYKYKVFYGTDAARRKDRFPTRLDSTKDEQPDKVEDEDLEATEDEDLDEDECLDEDEDLEAAEDEDLDEDEYLEAAEDEYPDPTLRRDIEDTEPEFLDPVEPGSSAATAQAASSVARGTYWAW